MSAKILVSGLANTGKTSLLQSLTDVLVVAHDGKKYPFPQPHVNVDTFDSMEDFINLTNEKIGAYKEKFGELPKTIVFDSVSKIFETLSDNCTRKFAGFDAWKNVNKEVHEFLNYIENILIPNGLNVVIISHAVWNTDTGLYELVAQGSFAKKGGFLSEVDNAVFLEVKNGKRVVHHRSPKFASRTVLNDIPDSQPTSEYSLQSHIDQLQAVKDKVAEFIL